MENGRLELSNNRAERSIKSFIIGQKNFLFGSNPLGAQASAGIYSLIETAKETEYYFVTGNGAHDAVQAVLEKQNPDRSGALHPTGAVHTERLSADAYLTQSNGVTVQNQLDTGTSVTCLTRNDWANTFPDSVDSITMPKENPSDSPLGIIDAVSVLLIALLIF